jgi:hypothetical protein
MAVMIIYANGCKAKDNPKQRYFKTAEKYVPQYPGAVDINKLKPGIYIENPNGTFTPTDTIVLMPTPREAYENKFVKTSPSGYIMVSKNINIFKLSFWKGENLIYSTILQSRELGKMKATPVLRFFESDEFGKFNSEKLGLHFEVPDGVKIVIE